MSGANGAMPSVEERLGRLEIALIEHSANDEREQSHIREQLDRIATAITGLGVNVEIIRETQVEHGKAIGALQQTDAVQTAHLESVRPKLASIHEEQIEQRAIQSVLQRHPKTAASLGAALAALAGAVANSEGAAKVVARVLEWMAGQ